MDTISGFLFGDNNLVFTISLSLVVAFAIIELIGITAGASLVGDIDSDVDFDTDADISGANAVSGFFRWLGVGKVPLIIFLVSFLASFGIIGLVLNWLVFNLLGLTLHPLLSAPIALVVSLPFVRSFNKFIIRIFPSDHSNAISVDNLVGLSGPVTVGIARAGNPAEVRVRDQHGVTHLVRAVPVDPAVEYPQGTVVSLVKRDEKNVFSVTVEL